MTVSAVVRVEPSDRPSLSHSLLRFGVTGVCSVGLDVGLLSLLHSGLGVHLVWATLTGYVAGLLVNYSLNRNWTFKATADHSQTLVRFAAVVAFNVASTLLLVLGLSHLGLFYLLSKLIAVALNAVINFVAGRYWIFSE